MRTNRIRKTIMVLSVVFIASTAMAAPVYWDQTRRFCLIGTPERLIRYDGDGQLPDIEKNYTESLQLTFQGAPLGFTLAGTDYKLTGVEAVFDSIFNQEYILKAHDSAYLSSVTASGGALTAARIYLLSPADVFASVYDVWEGNLNRQSNDPLNFHGIDGTAMKSWTQPLNFVRNWQVQETGNDSFLGYISSHETYSFDLLKNSILFLTNWQNNDNYTYVENTISDWSGSMSIRYIYEPEAVPTPVPASLLLLISGLGFVAVLARHNGKQ